MSSPTLDIYPLENYPISYKEAQTEEDPSIQSRMKRLQLEYSESGKPRISVEAALVVHENNFPHMLFFKIANSFFKLPGDYLKPGENEVEGLKKRLNMKLAPLKSDAPDETEVEDLDWDVTELLATWWRPNFENYMYPYKPAHVTRPKEIKRIYMVQLPEKRKLCLPKNIKIVAVPLFELYENSTKYGTQIPALAHNMSRYSYNTHKPASY